MDNIVLLRERGLSLEQAAAICKVGHATISRVYTAYKYAKANNYDALVKFANSDRLVQWARERCGLKRSEKAPSKKEVPPENPDNTATAFVALLDAIKKLTAAVDDVDRRLSAMQLTQQGMRGELSQSMKSVVEAMHVEGDILTKEQMRQTELLASIKSNTKRRDNA